MNLSDGTNALKDIVRRGDTAAVHYKDKAWKVSISGVDKNGETVNICRNNTDLDKAITFAVIEYLTFCIY